MSQDEVYEKAGFGGSVPRGTRPAVVVVDFTYGFTDTVYPTAADMHAQIARTRAITDLARAAKTPTPDSAIRLAGATMVVAVGDLSDIGQVDPQLPGAEVRIVGEHGGGR